MSGEWEIKYSNSLLLTARTSETSEVEREWQKQKVEGKGGIRAGKFIPEKWQSPLWVQEKHL